MAKVGFEFRQSGSWVNALNPYAIHMEHTKTSAWHRASPHCLLAITVKLAKSSLGIALIIHFGHNTDCTDWQIAPCSSTSQATPKLLGGTLDFSNSLKPTCSYRHQSSSPLHPHCLSFYSSLNHFSPALVQYVLEESPLLVDPNLSYSLPPGTSS